MKRTHIRPELIQAQRRVVHEETEEEAATAAEAEIEAHVLYVASQPRHATQEKLTNTERHKHHAVQESKKEITVSSASTAPGLALPPAATTTKTFFEQQFTFLRVVVDTDARRPFRY